MNELEIANFFWEGELSILEKACIKSFINNGFQVKLWSYNNLQFDGAESCDASKVLNYDSIASLCYHDDLNGKTKTQSSLAAFSDIIRVALINEVGGGWWFDTDCFCLKTASEFKKLRGNRKLCAGIQNDSYIANGVLYINEEYSKIYLNDILAFVHSMKDSHKEWGVFGPDFLMNFVNKYEVKKGIFPKERFYEIGWNEFDYFVDPNLCNKAKERLNGSYVCHIYTTSFNTRNLDKNTYYPKGCLLDEFYKVL